jgi:hypothetical protein
MYMRFLRNLGETVYDHIKCLYIKRPKLLGLI